MKKIEAKFDEDIKQIYHLCKDSVEHISEQYKYHTDVFDTLEVNIIREICSNYKYILLLNKAISANKNDKDFLRESQEVMDVWRKYERMVTRIKEGLFYLLIKWEQEGILM